MESVLVTTLTHPIDKILVALDGSETAERAFSYALALARQRRSELVLCSAIDRAGTLAECSSMPGGVEFASIIDVLDAAALATLEQAAARASEAGIRASTAVLDGRISEALVTYAAEQHVDAIVLGTHGKRGFERFFLGSTAEGVLRRTDVPVFVVPSGANGGETEIDRILVAVDDSDPSDAAAAFAIDFAATGAARLIFCGVAQSIELLDKAATYTYDPTALLAELRTTAAGFVAAQAEHARAVGVSFEEVVTDGDAVTEILRVATAQQVGLIVVGTHGRRGLRRFFMGSVAENVVRRSQVPVVVVRAPSKRARQRAPQPVMLHALS